MEKKFVLKTPGRKYSTTKDSKTIPPRQLYLNQVDPKNVRVGDIIDAGNYRKENSYIVTLDANKKLRLIPLPDQGHSGYGTIPLSVSSFFKNAIDAFKDKEDITIIATNNLYPHTSQVTKDWLDSHPCVIYLGDIKPSEQKGKKIVEL